MLTELTAASELTGPPAPPREDAEVDMAVSSQSVFLGLRF